MNEIYCCEIFYQAGSDSWLKWPQSSGISLMATKSTHKLQFGTAIRANLPTVCLDSSENFTVNSYVMLLQLDFIDS